MADFIFSPHNVPRPACRILYENDIFLLACDEHSDCPMPIKTFFGNGLAAAFITLTDNFKSVIRAMKNKGVHFVDDLRICTGIIWNTVTDEYCIFRDKFGFTPILTSQMQSEDFIGECYTTSPDYHLKMHRMGELNREWIAHFLTCSDKDNNEDVWRGTGRIAPGEARFSVIQSAAQFIEETVKRASGLIISPVFETKCPHNESNNYWNRRHYRVCVASHEALVDGLRQKIINAVKKIPSENPCFTLSGGLDSSGITSAYCKNCLEKGCRADAFSLISESFKSCDESPQLDILEKALPIRLKRISMDSSWALSEPEIADRYAGYGPPHAPGIESVLNGYRAVYREYGPRTIITGYGGNFIVKVRREALWRDMLSRFDLKNAAHEVRAMSRSDIKSLANRIFSNFAGGLLRDPLRKPHPVHPLRPETWIHPLLIAQYPPDTHDAVFELSHMEERAQIPLSSDWEMCTRALDIAARLSGHHFYDPLMDPELYDFCAQIPPREFLKCGDYRPIYKEALSAFLPPEIIAHPKCQSFDDNILDGLIHRAGPLVTDLINHVPADYVDSGKLMTAYQMYCDSDEEMPIIPLWRSIGLSLWLKYAAPK